MVLTDSSEDMICWSLDNAIHPRLAVSSSHTWSGVCESKYFSSGSTSIPALRIARITSQFSVGPKSRSVKNTDGSGRFEGVRFVKLGRSQEKSLIMCVRDSPAYTREMIAAVRIPLLEIIGRPKAMSGLQVISFGPSKPVRFVMR